MSMEEIVQTRKSKKRYLLVSVIIVLALVSAIYFVIQNSSSSSPAIAANGDNVSVFYRGSLSNGTVFSSNFGSTPFSFVLGSGQVIPGFNNAIIGMKVGETKNVTIPPAEAYGYENSSLIITVPLSDFGNNTVNVGEHVTDRSGQSAVITAVNSTSATLNFNSPLAGETLFFQIKLVSIKK